MNGVDKEVKLHELLLNLTDLLEDAIDCPAGESTSLAHLSPPTSQNGAPGLSSNNLIDFNSPPPGQNINGPMATLNINWYYAMGVSIHWIGLLDSPLSPKY